MSKHIGMKVISCLGGTFKQPIADLVQRLLTVTLPEFPDGPPRSREVDYAATLVLLLVATFEAWVSRVRFFDKRTCTNDVNKKFVLPWLRSLYDSKLHATIDRLAEVYFLRDAIAHNHIWTYDQRWVQGVPQYTNFDLDLTWQSDRRKVERIIHGVLPLPSIPRTKLLGLNVVPGFIGRKDVAIVFKTVKDALKLLDELGHLNIVPKVPMVRFDGKPSFPFWGLIGKLQKSVLVKGL